MKKQKEGKKYQVDKTTVDKTGVEETGADVNKSFSAEYIH